MAALVEEFQRFANLFPEPILLVCADGHLCAANRSARRALLGNVAFDSGHLLAQFIQEAPAKLLEYLRACSRSGDPLPGTFTFGTAVPPAQLRCLGSSYRARDEQQRALVVLRFTPKEASTSRFIALNRQIDQLRTEIARRIRVEQALDEQRQLLQVTLASIGDAVVATDPEGRITFMNTVAEAHMDCTQAETLGHPLEEVFVIRNEYTGEGVENPVQKVLKTGKTVGLANHTVLVRRDGGELPIDDSAAPIRDAGGKLFGVVLVFHEISESRRLQRELMHQTDALKDADRRKDQFLAVLAHELRNPLAPLRNGLQIARMKVKNDETLQRTVEMMERQLAHLVRLVNDLMDVSRVSRGVIELRCAPVFIADVLARSIEAVRPDIEARGHEFHIDIPAQPINVNGDADRLTQVFSNLLTNSAKYSHDGGSIRLSVVREGVAMVISIADKGIGIPPDQIDHVFDMFSQVRMHQGRAEGGLGIGLSLVRTLVQMHGGSVTAHSDGPGTGSTFTVRLPVSLAEMAPSGSSIAPGDGGKPLRILVADDNKDVGESLRLLLEIAGHEVRTASTGWEALQQVDDFHPAIVFMDVGMPELDGIAATQKLRQRPGGESIIVVALTGWGQPQDREKTRLAGVDRHVVKPISFAEIEELISLARRRMDD